MDLSRPGREGPGSPHPLPGQKPLLLKVAPASTLGGCRGERGGQPGEGGHLVLGTSELCLETARQAWARACHTDTSFPHHGQTSWTQVPAQP